MLSRIRRVLLATPLGILGALTAMPLLTFPVAVVFGICVGTALFCAVYFGLEGFGEQKEKRNEEDRNLEQEERADLF